MLGLLPTAEDAIRPFDARRVALENLRVVILREPHAGKEVSEVYRLNS